MKRLLPLALLAAIALFCNATVQAGTLLDDHFLLGNRTNQSLPTSSQWFASTASIFSNVVGAMTWIVPASSSMAETYFMPPGNPSGLKIGDTLKVTLTFSNLVMGPTNSGQNLRLGIYNYSAGGARITSDSFSTSSDAKNNGTSVQGYMATYNFSQVLNTTNALRVWKRSVLDNNLMANLSPEYAATMISSNANNLGDPGFSNNVPYTLVFSITRTGADAVVVSNSVMGPNLNLETDGADTSGAWTNFDAIAIRPASASGTASNIVFTELKVEGPPGILTPPAITLNPGDMTLTVSDFGIFTAGASGSAPLGYQWYFNNTSTPLAGQTNSSLTLTNIQLSQAGQYFVIASNSQGSATSTVATLTVNTPAHTPRGVIVNDTFQNNSRGATVNSTTSDWLASVDSTLGQATFPGPMVGFAQTNTATLWIANFVDPSASDPVDLAVGDALRLTLTFTPTNVAAQNTGSLRFGMFDFYDGSRILFEDGNLATPSWSGSGGGTNARGYMVTLNFATVFGDGTPIGIQVRNNLTDAGLMNSTGDYLSLGSGPSGMSNAPGFLSGSQYTLQITAARMDTTLMQVSALITGPQLNTLGFLAYDNAYFTHRFSAFAIRPNRNTDSADAFTFSSFKAEVISATNTPVAPFLITSAGNTTPTNFFLNWNSVAHKFYQIQSTTNLTAPIFWITNTSLAAGGSSATYTNLNTAGTNVYHPVPGVRPAEFYRVVSPLQP